ncbi:phage protein GemA/Gp16 family protein [Dethiosulfatarculus sandiegensis]|uniref:GemA protein n=1 Tax=Dethiosulfatarculus sandiegensis TaxID=1429043 RepID=A0A0D2JH32_9BACT|nr:phage protein GemA/Gp16 family protein [Dethiosulfatarculus sandiegensis]KIX15026.1 hypothetical protein X474_05630 [Dethiosulfatarculus sandiegensis]
MTRRALLAKVHIGKKSLCWSDDEYRDILRARYGRDSASKLSNAQLFDLCAHFARHGVDYKGKKKSKKGAYYNIPETTPYYHQKLYILALWNKLGWKISGIDLRCKKQFGVDKLTWLNDQYSLQTLAKDLYSRCQKRGLDPTPHGN